ncbi:hypothetical protein FHX42_000497 [Saccharopolyspora lacisalsi]|uniref:DUF695 domain-containing protein n=1 Tax=Halosaccharopolyspora lacisalsi TaxID=1000566 RepID=A0A839DWM9_9PSEU|nr:hypothetical protein [Halosaccharopolyspora lacisalsi]MBA8823168.1 hypothetical protein [Halosaccharopolyspora lacisalsi]
MRGVLRFLRRRFRGHESESGTDVATDARVRALTFWQRWYDLLPEVSAALGDGESSRVDHQLAEAVALVHPRLTFSIERGNRAVYALVVTGQADPELRPYTDAWRAAAPETDSLWEYHDAVPPVPDPTQVTVNLHGGKYPLEQVLVAAQVDAGLVDVAVYHPGFAELGEAEREALTFLPLHATLGERVAADRLGRVETAEREPQGSMDLLEFRDLVRGLDGEPGDPERGEDC